MRKEWHVTTIGAEDGYRYRGVPLLPTIIEELAVELFGGRVVARQDIITAVVARHRELGGAESGADVVTQAKKALTDMCRDGAAAHAGPGHYRIARSSPTATVAPQVDAEEATEAEVVAVAFAPERTIGTGAEGVYVYYLPGYRKLAEMQATDRWPCKIGLTRGDVAARVMGQVATALPEVPVIGLEIRTPRARDLEQSIQAALGLGGRRIEAAPGREWFNTSPSEVEGLYLGLVGLVGGEIDS